MDDAVYQYAFAYSSARSARIQQRQFAERSENMLFVSADNGDSPSAPIFFGITLLTGFGKIAYAEQERKIHF